MIAIIRTAIGAIIVSLIYIFALNWFVENVLLYLTCSGALAALLRTLFNYCRAIREAWLNLLPAALQVKPQGDEPAFKNYFHYRAFLDLRDVFRKSLQYCIEDYRRTIRWNIRLVDTPFWFVYWPFGVIIFGLLALAVPIVLLGLHLAGMLHLLVISSLFFVQFILLILLRTMEKGVALWRHSSLCCSNNACKKNISFLHYHCPECGVLHRRLLPGPYGIFFRRCQCRRQQLPVLSFLGREALSASCPYCKSVLNGGKAQEGNRTNLLMIGESVADKANYLDILVKALKQRSSKAGHRVKFRKQKNSLDSTYEKPVVFPAELAIQRLERRQQDHLLLFYDDNSNRVDAENFYNLPAENGGILFLIDAQKIVRQMKLLNSETPRQSYDRFIRRLRQVKSHFDGAFKNPLAVIITNHTLAGASFPDVQGSGRQRDNADTSYAIRQWLLANGQEKLLRIIANDFDNVRYYSCHLRKAERGNYALQPDAILEPLKWLLKKKRKNFLSRQKEGAWRHSHIAYSAVLTLVLSLFFFAVVGAGNLGSAILAHWQEQNTAIEHQTMQERYVNTRVSLNLRNAPGVNKTKVLQSLVRGTKLWILEEKVVDLSQNIRWYRVKTEQGWQGWVASGKMDVYLSRKPVK